MQQLVFFATRVLFVLLLLVPLVSRSQEIPETKDTFFLSKKGGLLGKLGKSISIDTPGAMPVKTANPFLIHEGKIVRHIAILSLGFERNIHDTARVKNSFGGIIANAFHKNTRDHIITHNLFFKPGSKINPWLVADNERHLRDQVYIQDSRILVVEVPGSNDSADVIVITKDVFSIGASASANGLDRARISIKEENFGGSGSRIGVSTFYERNRKPNFGYGADMVKRNVRGSFIDWSLGFQTYKNAFNSNRGEESVFYTSFNRPLVTLYIPWIGAADIAFSKSHNAYLKDSLFQSDFKYSYLNLDAWFGYNFGSKKLLSDNVASRFRKFIAFRALHLHFHELPHRNQLLYDYRYANISGALAAFTIFKQDFYKTNFIYGFGRNEDVPEGFNVSAIGGWINKDNRARAYYGLEGQHSHFNSKGHYSAYTLRFGGYSFKNNWEDVDLLLGTDHFTRLTKIGRNWLTRNFYGTSITKQVRPVLNQPLFLRSDFGLPYFDNGPISADFRATGKLETVFYNTTKYLGFRMAPFLFADLSLVTPIRQRLKESELYSAWGAGVRTRNENLVFGTVELRAYFFPKPIGYMRSYKIELSTSLRFKYNRIFIKKPDFVVPN